MEKKIFIATFLMIFTFCITSAAANTVTITFEGLDTVDLELMMIEFHLDDQYDYPLDVNWETYDGWTYNGDFIVTYGSAVPIHAAWTGYTMWKQESDTIDLARGFTAYSASFSNSNLALVNGVFATIVSENTTFAIDESAFLFKDSNAVQITDGFKVSSESLEGGVTNVIVNFATVPVPTSLLLLSGGVCAILGINRRKK